MPGQSHSVPKKVEKTHFFVEMVQFLMTSVRNETAFMYSQKLWIIGKECKSDLWRLFLQYRIWVLTWNCKASSGGNQLGSHKQRKQNQGSVFGTLISLQSGRLTNIGSSSGGVQSVISFSWASRTVPEPTQLAVQGVQVVYSRQSTCQLVTVTIYLDLMPRFRMRGDIPTLRLRLSDCTDVGYD
jgi:hypothetical protein